VFEEEDFFEVVEAMNSDKAPTLTVTLWHSSKLIGKRRYHEVFHTFMLETSLKEI
jgi:hypothetical protein